jgi:hypothetical protein
VAYFGRPPTSLPLALSPFPPVHVFVVPCWSPASGNIDFVDLGDLGGVTNWCVSGKDRAAEKLPRHFALYPAGWMR